jgi:hypothetical protein
MTTTTSSLASRSSTPPTAWVDAASTPHRAFDMELARLLFEHAAV